MSLWTKQGHIVTGQSGELLECPVCPCNDVRCADIIATMHQEAIAIGSEMHVGEAVLFYNAAGKTYVKINANITIVGWYWNGTVCHYVNCDCVRNSIDSSACPVLVAPFSGACSCFDIREILQSHPTEFGVLEMTQGSNAVVRTVSTTNTIEYHCNRNEAIWDDLRQQSYLDYRALVVVFDCDQFQNNSNDGIRQSAYVFYPADAVSCIKASQYGYDYNIGNCRAQCLAYNKATVELDGFFEPFTYDARFDTWWRGEFAAHYKLYDTRIEAYAGTSDTYDGALAMTALDYSNPANGIGCFSYDLQVYGEAHYPKIGYDITESHACITTPSKTIQSSNPGYVTGPHYYSGQTYYMAYYTTVIYKRPTYCINYIDTNRGLLLNGIAGYHESYDVLGLNSVNNQIGNLSLPSEPEHYYRYNDFTINARIYEPADDMKPCPGHSLSMLPEDEFE